MPVRLSQGELVGISRVTSRLSGPGLPTQELFEYGMRDCYVEIGGKLKA